MDVRKGCCRRAVSHPQRITGYHLVDKSNVLWELCIPPENLGYDGAASMSSILVYLQFR